MSKPYRIAIVGPGGVGSLAIREILRLPEYELVGVYAFSDSKKGVDAGELAGVATVGIEATTDFDDFLAIDSDAVLYTARDFGDWRSDTQILSLLEAGKNVITPLPYHYLKSRGEEFEARFQEAAQKGSATLHGSGITPGFYNERLALLLTGVSNDVTRIRFREFFNAEPLAGAIETLKLFGFGSPKEVAESNVAVAMMAENYLRQPIQYVADKLGIEIDKIERTSQMKVAPQAIETPAMTIEEGTVGLVSYAWTGYSKGKPFYTTEVYWYLGDVMRPEDAPCNDFWTIDIEGRPSMHVTIASQGSYEKDLEFLPDEPSPAGYIMTVVAMLQSVPAVIAAEPGLLQPEMPQFHWKPDQRD